MSSPRNGWSGKLTARTMLVPAQTRRVRFGAFEVDLRTSELRKHGLKIKLQDQPFQVLALLLERPGEMVSREELRQKLWPADTFVDFDVGLNNAIKRLRDALCDTAESPRYIETLPRRGYRFIASVADAAPVVAPGAVPSNGAPQAEAALIAKPAEDAPAVTKARPRPRSLWSAAFAAAAGLALLLALYLPSLRQRVQGKAIPPKIQSLAVLPLENLSGDPAQEYFADGMTEALITDLGKIEALRVISRTSAMHYKGTRKTLAEIARELQVDALVEGTVARSGDRVRITANLVQASPEKHLWAGSFERDLRDVLTLQDDVSRAIANGIQIRLTPQEQARLASVHPVNPEAHDLYLRGMFFLNKKTVDGMRKSIDYFQQAIDKDPGYAMPYVFIAQASALLGNYTVLSPEEAYPRSRAAAARALELDDGIAEAHTQLAWSKLNYDFDWSGAEREFQRALELNPNSAMAHQGYAMYFVAMGKFNQALDEIKRAEELDPLSLHIIADRGWFLFHAHRPDEAIAQLQKALDLDSNFGMAHYTLGCAYEQKGMFDQAVAEFQKAATREGPSPALAHTYAMAGKRREAIDLLGKLKLLSRQKYVSPYHVALIYTALGDKDPAFAWLEKAYRDRYWMMPFLKVDPRLDPLRSDPRFQDLSRRMNFPQ